VQVVDLEGAPWPLQGRRFAGIVVTNYLYRPLFPHLFEALAEDGAFIYETFALATNASASRPIPISCCDPANCSN